MLEILEFMFSSWLKFIGCFIMLTLILAVIEATIVNICRTIINTKKLKYIKELNELESNKQKDNNIKPNRNW